MTPTRTFVKWIYITVDFEVLISATIEYKTDSYSSFALNELGDYFVEEQT